MYITEFSLTFDCLYMDALSASVPMRFHLYLHLTLMASGLCRLLAVRSGNGRRNATTRNDGIDVRLGRKTNNRFLLNASHDGADVATPWLESRRPRISFPRSELAGFTSFPVVGNRG